MSGPDTNPTRFSPARLAKSQPRQPVPEARRPLPPGEFREPDNVNSLLLALQDLYNEKKAGISDRADFERRRDKVMMIGLQLGQREGKAALKQRGIKFIGNFPVDEQGKVADTDSPSLHGIYVVFPKSAGGSKKRYLQTDKHSLISHGEDSEQINALLNEDAVTIVPEEAYQTHARLAVTIVVLNRLIRTPDISVSDREAYLQKKDEYILAYLNFSEIHQQEFGLERLFNFSQLQGTDEGILHMYTVKDSNFSDKITGDKKPIELLANESLSTAIDLVRLSNQYEICETGEGTHEDQTGAEIYRIFGLHDAPYEVAAQSISVAPPHDIFVLHPVVEVVAEPQNAYTRLARQILGFDGEIRESRTGVGTKSVATLQREKYVLLFQWLQKVSALNDEPIYWEKIDGTYQNEVSLLMKDPENVAAEGMRTDLDVQYLKQNIRKGKSNFASEILRILELQ